MRKIYFSAIFFVLLAVTAFGQHTPHPIFGNATMQDGSNPPSAGLYWYITNLSVPGDTIPGGFLDSDPACYNGNGSWWSDCGNFENQWQPGHTIMVYFYSIPNSRADSMFLVLDNSNYQVVDDLVLEHLSVEEDFELVSKQKALLINYPNPFNPETLISWDVPANMNGQIDVSIYNIVGQKIKAFRPTNEEKTGSMVWNGVSDGGNPVASGIYFCILSVDNEIVKSKRMLLMK